MSKLDKFYSLFTATKDICDFSVFVIFVDVWYIINIHLHSVQPIFVQRNFYF